MEKVTRPNLKEKLTGSFKIVVPSLSFTSWVLAHTCVTSQCTSVLCLHNYSDREHLHVDPIHPECILYLCVLDGHQLVVADATTPKSVSVIVKLEQEMELHTPQLEH